MTRAIARLASDLGMDVVAEGIETPEQLAKLREFGCQLGQGFYFARPVPLNEARSLIYRSGSFSAHKASPTDEAVGAN